MITGTLFEKRALAMLGALNLRLRHFLYKLKQKRESPITFDVPANGVRLCLLPEGQISEYLYLAGYERRELCRVASILKPGMRVVDVGANVGLYSILAAKIVGVSGKVWAFEPSSESIKRLVRNLVLNRVAGVELARLALADIEDGFVSLRRDPGYRDGDRYLATRSRPNSAMPAVPGDIGDDESVPVTTLDRYLCVKKSSSPIDFVKIDVEGAEFAVFRGAEETLRKNERIVVMFECTPQGCRLAGHEQKDVFRFLMAMGLRVYCVDEKSCTWESHEELLKSAGNLWACRDKSQLPNVQGVLSS